MFTRNKITKQSVGITALIVLWVMFFLWMTMVDFERVSTIDNYQQETIHVKDDLNAYIGRLLTVTPVEKRSTLGDNAYKITEFKQGMIQESQKQIGHISQSIIDMNERFLPELGVLDNSYGQVKDAANRLDELSKDILLHETDIDHLTSDKELIEAFAHEKLIEAHWLTENLDQIIYLTEKNRLAISEGIRKRTFTHVGLVIIMVVCAYIWIVLVKVMHPLKKIRNQIGERASGYYQKALDNDRKDEIGELIDVYNHFHSKTNTIESLMKKLSEHDHFEDILDFIFSSFKPYIPYNRIGIAVLSSDKTHIRALSARSDKSIKLGKNYTAKLNDTSLESIISSGEPRVLNDLENYYSLKRHSDSTKLMLDEGMRSSITFPLIVRNECVGVVFFSSVEKNKYEGDHINFLRTIAGSLASAFDHSFLHDQLLVSTIRGFAQLVESKDSDTGNHIDRMQTYSVMIAELLYREGVYKDILDDGLIKQIKDFSPLHDIGKVGIPDGILLKPGKLTAEEFALMKTHVIIGSDILKDMNDQIKGESRAFYTTGIEIVRHHHEKYDGSGYPDRLKGQSIPLSARIVALADVLDALTSKRPYKEAFDMEKARRIISEGSGGHFDPIIVDIVLKNWSIFESQINDFHARQANEHLSMIS